MGHILTPNPMVDRSDVFFVSAHAVVRPDAVARAAREIASWPGYASTPLRELTSLAGRVGVGQIFYKDEASRFGVDSFKPMGGGYAVSRIVARHVERATGCGDVTASDLLSGQYAELASQVTVTCATDGNHGRAVAWAAQQFGCRAVIYMASIVTPVREQAMTSFGAEVVRSTGNHEVASDECAEAAAENGWFIVSETERATEQDIAYDTLAGYRTLLGEVESQLPKDCLPTHMFIQAGVGGLAATSCVFAAERWGSDRPVMVVVESDQADCIRRSFEAGAPRVINGDLDTIMAGLAAGEASGLALPVLRAGADFGMAISDDAAVHAMKELASIGVVGGESGVAGLAALLSAAADPVTRETLGLTRDSVIVTIGTEGATDREVYHDLVGKTPDDVGSRD